MPNYTHYNPTADSINRGVSAITQALYAAPVLRRQAEQAQIQNRLMEAQRGTQEALAGKYGAQKTQIDNIEAARMALPEAERAFTTSNPEQLAKARLIRLQGDGYAAAAADPSKINNFGKLQAAEAGKALYDNGVNNVIFDLFNGNVSNEQNPLNQSAILYGNDGSVVGGAHAKLYGAQAGTEKSKQAENYASARQHDASARNQDSQAGYYSNKATAEKTTESFAGYDAQGNEIYDIVPKASGGKITKRNTLNDKNANMTIDAQTTELNDIQVLTNQIFGISRNKKTGELIDGSVPVDGESMAAITQEAVRLRRASDNKMPLPDAVRTAINNLTGGAGVAGMEGGIEEHWYGDKVKPRKLPAKQKAKAQPKPSPASNPYGAMSDEELLQRLNGNV